jgi:hypothetical protein
MVILLVYRQVESSVVYPIVYRRSVKLCGLATTVAAPISAPCSASSAR